MELIELEQKERVPREAAAARLHEIAEELASGNAIRIRQGGLRFCARVPDEVELKIEFEIEDDGAEFEIELSW